MKKSKKVVLFMLSMVLVLSMAMSGIMTVSAADTDDDVTINNEYKVGLLEALKISKVSGIGISTWTGSLTRGEAAFLIAGMLRLNRDASDTTFNDVSSDAFYSGSIASLNTRGVVLKVWGSAKYRPDEPITYGEFITMLCRAMGYSGYAEAKGGYPIGYISVAKQFKLTKGVPATSDAVKLDKKYVPTLMVNALDAYYMSVTSVDNDGNATASKQGTILEDYFDIHTYEGILQEVGHYSMTNDFLANDDYVTVNGITFKAPAANVGDYGLIGQKVKMYYNEKRDGIYIFPTTDNTILKINMDDITKENTNSIEYTNEDGKTNKANIAFDRTIVYNGSKVLALDTSPSKIATITLVDNDADGKYDVVNIFDYKVAQIDYTDSYNKVYGLSDGTTLNLKDAYISMTTTAGKKAKISSIAKDDVIMYAINNVDNEKYKIYTIILCRTTVEGTVTATGTDEVAVDGTYYPLTDLFINGNFSYNKGDKKKFYLTADSKVIYTDRNSYQRADAKYAIYLGYDQTRKGLHPGWEVELYTQDGAHVYLPVAEKIKLNGVKYKAEAEEVIGTFAMETLEGTIIKYNISTDGELSEFITPDDWKTEYQPWKLGQGFNKYKAPSGDNWRIVGPTATIGALYRVASDAIRFIVNYDSQGKFDEKHSAVTTIKMDTDQAVGDVTLYDIDESGCAHAYIATPAKENIPAGKGTNVLSFLLITKVFKGEDSDGNPGIYVTGLLSGSEKCFFLSEENYEQAGITDTATMEPYVVGNIVRIRTDGQNIMAIMRIDKNNDAKDMLVYTKSELDNPSVAVTQTNPKSYEAARQINWMSFCIFAKVLYVKNGFIYFANATKIGEATSTDTAFTMPIGGTVYKYDPNGDDLYTVVTANDLKESTGITDGDSELNGSTVLVNVVNYAIMDIVILD
ncbi:MAG: S-layer homology domain-containing protein [Bacillota bacterium]|nr:S-layer homology domain-containing protein [Bacillota bacterium]